MSLRVMSRITSLAGRHDEIAGRCPVLAELVLRTDWRLPVDAHDQGRRATRADDCGDPGDAAEACAERAD